MWIVLESRRRGELARLVERHGATPLSAPVMQEVPVPLAEPMVELLRSGRIDVLVLLTGVGARMLASAVEGVMARDGLVIAARGPKTVAALKELGVRGYLVAPEPFTWDLLVAALPPLAGKHVVVQEYGVPHPRLVAALTERGATVTALSIYRWALPEDLAPAERALDALVGGEAEAILFTSAPQAAHLLEIAERRGRRAEVAAALARVVVGSVGPSCSEGLRAAGIVPTVEPEHSHMGQLVIAVAERLRAVHDGAA